MPDFNSIYAKHECEMLQDAHDAISKCELWDWMREFTPHPNEGFMFTNHPNLTRITATMGYEVHSGASWAWTLRIMEVIAKKGGWEAYKADIAAKWPKDRQVCACRAKEGMTIGWCGVAGFGVPGCEH
jgi:hypothetical protein